MTGGLVDALRLERVRILSVRSTYVLAAVAVLLSAATAVLLASFGSGAAGGGTGDGTVDPAAAVAGTGPDPVLTAMVLTGGAGVVPLPFTATFLGVLGVLSVGHDYRYGLSRALLAAQPNRSAFVAARLIVLALTAVAVTLAGVAVDVLVGTVLCRDALVVDGSVARAVLGAVLLGVLWAWLGAAGTWLLRATVPVLTVLLVVPLVVEPTLTVLSSAQDLSWLRPVVPWLPFAAGQTMTAVVSTGDGPGPVRGGLVFAGFVAAVLLPAWQSVRRRDA